MSWSPSPRAKIERLEQRYLADPTAEDPIVRWLGHATMHDVQRGTAEPAADYILRHTRLIPRDLIEVGNALCNAVPPPIVRAGVRPHSCPIDAVGLQGAGSLL